MLTSEPRQAMGADDAADPADRSLSAFVPRLAVELAEDGPSHTSVEGSMLSADISGFTALSEKLAAKGKAGAEEITELVNKCFTALIDAAYEYGGEVLKFGGDALLILFREEDHVTRAVDAGLAMQHALRSSATAKRAELTMTVGVADGPFDVFLAGTDYRELLVTGPRASEVIRLEGEAAKGDTLVSTSIASALPRDMLVREEAGGWVVTGSTGARPTGPRRRARDDEGLSPFVPAAVREQLEAFAGLGGEHRLVTVGFLMVGGVAAMLTDDGPGAVGDAFHLLVDDVVSACDEFGVTVLHTDIAPDGIKFVLCAGAPINAGDTADAMLETALRITRIDTPFALRQGVQSGRVFAGFLGADYRRTYTLMGDPVNTAARMLGKADDRDVVAVDTVVRIARTIFVTEELEPFLAKGKTEPITAHKIRSASRTVRREAAGAQLVGRERELATIVEVIGEAGVAMLTGPAGAGKSRLLEAALSRVGDRPVFQAACTPYGSSSPYSVFSPLFRVGTGVGVNSDPAEVGDHLARLIDEVAPELAPMLPLLAVPFGADVAPTPESDAIDPQFRRARIHDVVVDFLDAVLDGAVLLVIEDLHWVDSASGELVDHLVAASRTRPWSSVLTRRPTSSWEPPAASEHVRHLAIEPLTDRDIRAIAIAVSERPLADSDLDAVVERSGGNPLFATELAKTLGGDSDVGAIPASIEELIATRIDGLPPEQRRLVRVASVFGQEFDLTAVDAVTPQYAELGPELDDMVERRRGSMYRFRHAMYRDAAYEGLPYGRRRALHGVVARYLEREAASPDAISALLSVHFGAAGEREATWRYAVRAGELAVAQHATREAADAFERALEAGRYSRSVNAVERAHAAEALGDQWYLLGRFDAAVSSFERARRSNDDPVRAVELIRKLGAVFERRGEVERAIRWYRRAANMVPPSADQPDWLVARAQARLGEAGIRSRRSEGEVCLELSRAALLDGERADDGPTVALALERIHLSLLMLRREDRDEAGLRALARHREVGDLVGVSRTLINLGVEAYYDDRWDEANRCYLEALDAARQAGTVVLIATAAINSAEILCDQGDWPRARELFDDALRNYSAIGYPAGIAAVTLFSAVAAMRQGSTAEADDLLTTASRRLRELDMNEWVDDLDSRRTELDVLRGGDLTFSPSALLERFGIGHPHRVRVLRSVALASARAGAIDQALSLLSEALGTVDDGYERALTLDAFDRVAPGSEGAADRQADRDRVYARLGVTRPPPLVPADLDRCR